MRKALPFEVRESRVAQWREDQARVVAAAPVLDPMRRPAAPAAEPGGAFGPVSWMPC
jgi:hypothetical protein